MISVLRRMDTPHFDAHTSCPMPVVGDAPSDAELAAVLGDTRTVAVVGASPDFRRTSHDIAVWLMDHTPYEVYLVNPEAGEDDEIRGHGFYASLAELPVVPDLVNVFRRAQFTPDVAEQAVAVGSSTLWLQLGVINGEAMEVAAHAGLDAIQNRCIKVEYARLRALIEAERHAAFG